MAANPPTNRTLLLDSLKPGGKHLVIQAWPSPGLLAALVDALGDAASQGQHIALLDRDAPESLGERLMAKVCTDSSHYLQGQGLATQPKTLIELLGNAEAQQWLDRLGLVLIPQGEKIFRHPYNWEVLAASLKDRSEERGLPTPRFIVVVAPHIAAESAIRDILTLAQGPDDWIETHWRGEPPNQFWWTIWTSQAAESYKNQLNAHPKSQGHWGAGPVLAHFAGLWQVSVNRLFSHSQQADVDQGQALQKDEGRRCYSLGAAENWDAWVDDAHSIGAVTVYEAFGNPWRGLQAVRAAGGQAVLANIVSKYTAFQNYFLANAQHFAHQPWQPLSPKKTEAAQAPLDTLLQLVRRIKTAGRLRLSVVEQALLGAKLLVPGQGSVLTQFQNLAALHLHPSLAQALTLRCQNLWNGKAGRFETLAYITLNLPDSVETHIEWLRPFRVTDDSGVEDYLTVSADHVLQSFLPGKTAVIAGRTFKIRRIDWLGGVVYASHDDTLGQPDYRISHRIELLSPENQRHEGEMADFPVIQHQQGYRIDKRFYRLDFNIHTLGSYESTDQWASQPHYHALPEGLPARHYREGRAARLRLLNTDGSQSLLTAPAAVALAAWLNEAAELLFPETGRFLLAVADVPETAHPASEPALGIVPRLGGHCQHDHSLWIFEDSNTDLGLARALFDHCQTILDLCLDHLNWLLTENSGETRPGTAACLENQILPAADFFAYGASQRDAALDFAALLTVLKQIAPWFGADGLNLRRRRSLEQGLQGQLLEIGCDGQTAQCDFCGVTIQGGSWQTLSEDGRIRCTGCQAHGVDSPAQLQALYPLVRAFFTLSLKQELLENIQIRLASQAELARQTGQSFIPTAGFDPRTVGLAVARSAIDERQRHQIWIESGFSPEQTAATLAHELTHIWQYNQLDYPAMQRKTGNLLLEGHAVWTAIAFLRQQARQPDPPFDPGRLAQALQDQQDSLQRPDEYGQGHALLVERTGGQDPFQWLLQHHRLLG